MKKKKVLNIVKFSVNDVVGSTTTKRTQAAVFYDDGSVEMLPMEDAVELCKRENIKMKQTTPEKLEANFQKYRGVTTPKKKKKEQENTSQEETTLIKKIKNKLKTIKNFILKPFMFIYEKTIVRACEYATLHILQRKKLKASQENKENAESSTKKNLFQRSKKKKSENKTKKNFFQKLKKEKNETENKNKFFSKRTKSKNKTAKNKTRKRIFTKVKAAIFAAVLMVAGAFGISSYQKKELSLNPQSKVESEADILNDLSKADIINLIKEYKLSADQVSQLIRDGKITNDDFKHLSVEQLLNITSSNIQQQEMEKISNFLNGYNITFAKNCLDKEAGEIRTVLTYTEANALNSAYNNYSKEDIQAIFNGSEAIDFTKAYKEGYLQLLGAFVLATDNNPVQLDKLINDENGKTFVKDYETTFYECKNLTGEDQVKAVTELYKRVVNDFAITSTNQGTIESYKLAVAPIVVAATSLFDDLGIDQTLVDQVTTYFNEVGLYSKATENFNMANALNGTEDSENPTYEQYKDAEINSLEDESAYYKSDKNRDLSQLDKFKSLVNWQFNLDANGDLIIGNTLGESIVLQPEEAQEKKEDEPVLTEATIVEPVKEPAVVRESTQSYTTATASYTTLSNNDYSYDNADNLESSPIPETPTATYNNTSDEVANTEGVEVAYNPEEELDNFQVGETNGQTFFEYDEPSEEVENTDSNESQATGNTDTTEDTVSEETNTENNSNSDNTIEEEYSITQMPDSNRIIIEYEETVEETPVEEVQAEQELTNEQKAEAIINDMAENPENYAEEAEEVFVYTK